MQSDKEHTATSTEPMLDTIESSKESTLEWLMELDRDEPEENLFVVDSKASADLTLSAYEAEVAARPMVRGREGADDLDTYIGEEIVLSEPGGNDIYSAGVQDSGSQEEVDAFEGLMAIEFSRASNEEAEGLATNVTDGSDILGLEDDDDIGDAYLVVKRVKKPAALAPQPEPESPEEPELVTAADPEPANSVDAAWVASTEIAEEIVLESDPAAPLAPEAGDSGVAMASEPAGEPSIGEASPVAEAAPPTDVNDYVNSVELPEDDKGFDDFLVAGNALAVGEEDFDALSLEAGNDQYSADADMESDLELHEDFADMAGFGEQQ